MTLRCSAALTIACASFAFLLPAESPPGAAQEQQTGGLITLYAGDETRCCFSFNDGNYGARIHDGELILDNTQIVWNLLQEGQISIGYVSHTGTNLVDLGEAYVGPLRDPRAQSPKPNLSVFHTLRVENRAVVWSGPPGKVYHSADGRRLIQGIPTTGIKHFTPIAGHTYLLRVRGIGRGGRDRMYKFHVIDIQPGHTLTLQWGVL